MIHVPSTRATAKMDTPVSLHKGICSCGWESPSIGTVYDALRTAQQHAEAKNEPCPDCGVRAGSEHVDACDVARCLETGLQRISCEAVHDCGRQVWTGEWPGLSECREYGFMIGGVLPDLNQLFTECRWDRASARWRKRYKSRRNESEISGI